MNELERFTTGHAVGVDVTSIERDLAALWRKASSADQTVTRACSWNLILHATNDAELARTRLLADALVEVVPSRTIVLHQDQQASGPEVEAYVTANCRKVAGGRLICSEEITINAHGRGGDHLPSLLRALQVPDIPTALLWAQLPPVEPVTRELVPGVDRIVLDSSSAETREELLRIEQLGGRGPARIADLTWLRQARVRLLIAGAFDGPVDAGMLYRLRRVDVRCAKQALPSAKLLLGWLTARLGWSAGERIDDGDRPGWLVPRQGGQVRVSVELVEDVLPCGLGGIAFESDQGERVEINAKGGVVTMTGAGVTREVSANEHSDQELAVAALGPRGTDKLYASALRRALELDG